MLIVPLPTREAVASSGAIDCNNGRVGRDLIEVLMTRKQIFGTHWTRTRFGLGARIAALFGHVALGRSPMTKDADGISNSFWLLFASLLSSVAIFISAVMAGIG